MGWCPGTWGWITQVTDLLICYNSFKKNGSKPGFSDNHGKKSKCRFYLIQKFCEPFKIVWIVIFFVVVHTKSNKSHMGKEGTLVEIKCSSTQLDKSMKHTSSSHAR